MPEREQARRDMFRFYTERASPKLYNFRTVYSESNPTGKQSTDADVAVIHEVFHYGHLGKLEALRVTNS